MHRLRMALMLLICLGCATTQKRDGGRDLRRFGGGGLNGLAHA